MRHKVHKHTLGLRSQHRAAVLANMASSLIEHGRIKTTLAKAKALRPFIEKVITLAKKAEGAEAKDSLHFRRQAISRLRNVKAVHALFDEKVGEFSKRDGGYTRIYKLGNRKGDAAEMALIELIAGSDEGYSSKTKKSASKSKAKAEKAELAKEEAVEAEPVAEATVETEDAEK